MEKKKLVYFFCVEKKMDLDAAIYNIHFNCLKSFAHVFDEALIVLSLKDGINIEDDIVTDVRAKFIKVLKVPVLTFETEENTLLRECNVFKKEIVDKIGSSLDYIFFGHSKGSTNQFTYDIDNIGMWVASMYFFNLNYMADVNDAFKNSSNCLYGFPLTIYDNFNLPNGWMYSGTFFWVNMPEIYNYYNVLKKGEIILPHFSNRYYAENLFPNSIEKCFATSYYCKYFTGYNDFYNDGKEIITKFCQENGVYDSFMAFYEKVKNDKV